jgi:single-strand DNA-binding protein
MSSAGLNKWIVSGNLAADAQIKTVELRDGDRAQVAEATLYVRKPRDREGSFTVRLSIWEKSYAWRKLPYLKKGSLIICTGSVDSNPYISSNGNVPKAGLEMTVLDIDLDIVKTDEEETLEAEKNSEKNPFESPELEPAKEKSDRPAVSKAEKSKDKKAIASA